MSTTGKAKASISLVEVVSVLFLAAIAVGVLVPAQSAVNQTQLDQSNVEACWNNVNTLGEAIVDYGRRHNGIYPSTLADLNLKDLPRCPALDPTKPSSYELGYQVNNLGEAAGRFTLRCAGALHAGQVGPNQPYYDSLYGMTPTSVNVKR